MGVVDRMRLGLAVLAAASLLVAGCGEGADDANVVTTNAVAAALADTADAPVYRVTTSLSQTLTFHGHDEQDMLEVTVVGTVSPDRQHFAGSIGRPSGSPIAGDGGISWEVWSGGGRVVMDTRDSQRLVDAVPGAELGPLEPGLFFVDAASIGADDPELLQALVGFSTPSLRELAENLPAALNTIDQTSENPVIYVGSTTSASLVEAQGGDPDVLARTASAVAALPVSPIQPASAEELSGLFVEILSAAEAQVSIEVDAHGLLRVLSTREDLSGFLSAFLEEGVVSGMTAQEISEARAELEGAELIRETHSVYETDPDMEVPLPPEATEDRTDQWRDFLVTAGFNI